MFVRWSPILRIFDSETGVSGYQLCVKRKRRCEPERAPGVRGGFLPFLGVVSYRIRILMYPDVSCMYLACILKDTCIPYVS